MTYSSQALGDQMKRVLDNVIRRHVSEYGWYGSADEGFRGNAWEGTLPPVTGLTGTVRLRHDAIVQTNHSEVPPGARYVGEEIEGPRIYHL